MTQALPIGGDECESPAELRGLVDGMEDRALFMIDEGGAIATWNRGAEGLTGYASADARGCRLAFLFDGADGAPAAVDEAIGSAARAGRGQFSAWLVRKDHSRLRAQVVLRSLPRAQVPRGGFSVALQDVSARHRVEAQLRASQLRWRTASELTSDYCYAFRVAPDGAVAVEWVAGAFTRITGYTPEEIQRRGHGFMLVHPDDVPIALARVQRLVAQQPDTSEFRIVTKNGEVRWIRESARPALDEGHGGLRVFGAAQDITEQRRAQEELRQRESELAHVLRLGTIWEMAMVLAHEINQPLGAIVSYAGGCTRRIRSGARDATELLEVIEAISAQAMRADAIVSRLQNFVRRREPRRDRVDINAVIEEAASLVAAEARERRISLQLRLEPGLQPLSADGVQIEQVVLNLARNGFDAMQGAESVRRVLTIATRRRDAGTIEVAVSDRGEGIAADDAERIFAPFYSTKASGLGMGLALCRSIVTAHGGTLWATPNEDYGSTFCFSLPTGV